MVEQRVSELLVASFNVTSMI